VELLIEHNADVNGRGDCCPLRQAVQRGYHRLVELLLTKGANVNAIKDIETPLTEAARFGNLKLARMLLDSGADPNICAGGWHSETSQTPLQTTAETGDIRMMELLLEYGAEIDKCGKMNASPLQLACYYGEIATVRHLLIKGADAEKCGFVGTPLQLAAERGHLDVLELLLGSVNNLEATEGKSGDILRDRWVRPDVNMPKGTALQRAAHQGHLEVIEVLCQRGANINAQSDEQPETPFQIAVKRGFEDVAALLLDFNPDLVHQGKSAILYAAANGQIEILKRIANKAPLMLKDDIGTALKLAAECGYAETVKLLLDHNESLKGSDEVALALRQAARGGHADCVSYLLPLTVDINTEGECPEIEPIPLDDQDTMHRDVPRQDKKQFGTALHMAASRGHDDVVSILIDHGSDPNLSGKYGTALQLSSYWGHPSTVTLLIGHGADVNAKGGWRGTALQRAASCGDYDPSFDESHFYGELSHYAKTVEILLESKAEVNAYGGRKGTALQRASRTGVLEIVQLLLREGALVNLDGGELGTALQRAADHDHLAIVKLLLAEGAEVNSPGGSFGTALQRAAEKGYLEVVRELLDAGADVDGGELGTPLQKASALGNVEIVKLLLECGANTNAHGGYHWSVRSRSGHEPDRERQFFWERRVKEDRQSIGSVLKCSMLNSRRREKSYLTVMRFLLEHGARFQGDEITKDLPIAIKDAAEMNDFDVVRMLLDSAPKLADQDLLVPLKDASKKGHAQVAEILLEKIEDMKSFQQLVSGSASSYNKPIYGSDMLPLAAGSGHAAIIILLLSKGFDINAPSPNFGCALVYAAMKGAVTSVKLLLERGANVNESVNSLQLGTALKQSAASGYLDIVQMLLDYGANHDEVSESESPFILAVGGGHKEIVELLLDRVGSSISENQRSYAFELAQARGFYAIACLVSPLKSKRMTVEAFTKAAKERAQNQYAFLNAAVMGSLSDVTRFLDRGVEIDAHPGGRGTALQEASARGFTEIVRLLLARGADIEFHGGNMEHEGPSGSGTALQRAAQKGHIKVVKLLLDSKAKMTPYDDITRSALERAAENGHTDIVKLLIDNGDVVDTPNAGHNGTALQRAAALGSLEMAKFLLDHGANINSMAGRRGTPLQTAASGGHLDVVQLLLENRADVNASIFEGDLEPPLFVAASNNFPEVVKVLLGNGADVNAPGPDIRDSDRGGMTPFQEAISKGHKEVVKLLLDTDGVDIDQAWEEWWKDGERTPLQHAVNKGHKEIEDMLRKKGAKDIPLEREDNSDAESVRSLPSNKASKTVHAVHVVS
jgi:ankyrin repeat protein